MLKRKTLPYCLFSCVFCFLLVSAGAVFAQNKDTVAKTDLVELLFKKQVAKQVAKNKKNNVYTSLFPAFGTTPASGFAAVVAANFAFHLGGRKTNLSSISASASYSVKRQFTLPIRSNIWLDDNKWNLLGDWRFIKYPQNTYGMGARSLAEQEVEVDYLYLRLYQHALRSVVSHFYAGGGLFCDQYWGIEQVGWDKLFQSDFEKYGYGTASRVYTAGLGINLLWDDRKNVITPKQGSYANIVYRFNPSYFGNEETWESAYVDFRKYLYMPSKAKKNVLGFWLFYWGITKGRAPYFLLPSNGWDTYTSSGRGYVQGRFRGRHMVSFETEYRYGISRNGLLGGVLFANASSYEEPDGSGMKYVNPAVGLGFRVKLNKTSDTNLIIDFAFGLPPNRGFYLDVGEIF
jgi:hypothetical protein